MRGLMIGLAVVAAVGGEWAAGFDNLAVTVTDVLAGLAFLAVGILAQGRSGRLATLAFVAGLAWFAGNLGGLLTWLHRPLMLHAALAYPDGRLTRRWLSAVLGLWWVSSLVTAVATNPAASIVLGLVTVVSCWITTRRSSLGRHRARRIGAASATAMGAALALTSADALVAVHGRPMVPPAVLYSLLVALAGLILVGGLLQPSGEADAVIEVTEDDPDLLVDALRREATAPAADSATRDLLTAAVARFDENRRLHQDLECRVDAVRASRRRLIEAGIAERQSLERRLADGTFGYLTELGEVLSALRRDLTIGRLANTCLAEVANTRADLGQLARGLHPAILTDGGLPPALADLAAHSLVPTTVRAPSARLPALVEATVWFGCAEAMANMGKYSGAAAARIDVDVRDGFLIAIVTDDGVGGAVVHPGGGLGGLADRMSAVDGTLTVRSPQGAGTHVTIRVPVP